MACSSDTVTSHCWQVDNFREQWDATYRNNGRISDSKFTLTTQSSISFALNLQFSDLGLAYTTFGVVLKEFGNKKSLEIDAKMWLENEDGQKFSVNSVQKQVFAKVGDKYKVQTILSSNDYKLLQAIYDNRKALFVYCEITALNLRTPASELRQEFHQNIWSAYENEMHDAIVKVGSTEFKVFKTFFMIQSDVFTQMFNSGFKEGITGEVEVKDISDDTMKHLIKWLYTGQMEDETKAEDLFKAAGKYNIKLLKKTCTEILLSTLNKDNAFARLILGVIHNSSQLKYASLDLIVQMSDTEMAKFAMSSEWMEFSRKNTRVADEVSELMRQKLNI